MERFNDLKDVELEIIALSVKKGFTSGRIGDLEWEVTFEKHDWEEGEDDSLLHIVKLIEEGYTSGYYPSWQLEANDI